MQEIPSRVPELGRIRIGDKDEKRGFPRKLDHFRLTSGNLPRLQLAAQLYGGTPREWKGAPDRGQYELYTATNAIDIILPTAMAASVSFEIWAAGGCQRRCNGQFVTHDAAEELRGQECSCPINYEAREALAKEGKACLRIMRLNVILPDIPGLGVWRLESHGYNATAEILGTLELLKHAGYSMVEATLRLEQRSAKKDGKTQRFNVPTLTPKLTTRQLLLSQPPQATSAMLSPSPGVPLLARPGEQGKCLDEHITDLYGEPVGIPTGPLAQEINVMLEALGKDSFGVTEWWQDMRRRYPDMTPAALTLAKEKLQARLAAMTEMQKPVAATGDDATGPF